MTRRNPYADLILSDGPDVSGDIADDRDTIQALMLAVDRLVTASVLTIRTKPARSALQDAVSDFLGHLDGECAEMETAAADIEDALADAAHIRRELNDVRVL